MITTLSNEENIELISTSNCHFPICTVMISPLLTSDIIRHSTSAESFSSEHRLDRTRIEITRAFIRLPKGMKKPDNECVFFVLKVYDGATYHTVERSWADFSQLKEDLLVALDAGHSCSGICPWLWEDLNHNFDYPTKKVNFRTWLQLRLRRHTKRTIQVFLEHFQELLDSMLDVLRQRHIKCKQFQEVCQVLAAFMNVRPPSMIESPQLLSCRDSLRQELCC
ncbi:hypothetical protein THRCLA_20729 [Thraustotheca clavata]|uniref:PX domain-containing protein n=1 Tax=Thraustotheca clavata TaxID=74557 RepID=A0A1W0A496_9STRA|nr:hypothetical protein THRCLA_20729 [Thraustotheca clavata]